jgi:hypothetical protein
MSARSIALIVIAVTAVRLNAEPPAEVQKAVERGIAALRTIQFADGSWGEYGPGSTALVAITLMEASVPPTDPAVINSAKFVRFESLRCKHSYSIATSIIALDRIGDNNDWPLIRLLTKRLLSGQQTDGGWSYYCPLGERQFQHAIRHTGAMGRASL